MVRQALADQSALGQERSVPVFLQQHVGLVGVVGVVMFGQRDLGDDRAQGIDLGDVAVGLDRDGFAVRRRRGAFAAGAPGTAARGGWRPAPRSAVGGGWAALCSGAGNGGACSLCQLLP